MSFKDNQVLSDSECSGQCFAGMIVEVEFDTEYFDPDTDKNDQVWKATTHMVTRPNYLPYAFLQGPGGDLCGKNAGEGGWV